jgi:hypothetical protein
MAELTSKPSPDVFGTKVGSKSCKLPSKEDTGTSPLSPLVYVKYKDHVIYKNIQQPIAKAVERETVGWLTNQNDEIMLIENDRSLRVKGGGVNGIVLLKSCILEIQVLPLQKISNWPLNSPENKGRGEYALKPKKRKTQPKTNSQEQTHCKQ